jgi:hypothetical protein
MTLIEILAASAILVFGIIAILSLLSAGTGLHRRAVDETVAVQIGESVLANFRMLMEYGQEPRVAKQDTPRRHPDYFGYHYAVRLQELGAPTRKDKERQGREFLVEVLVIRGTIAVTDAVGRERDLTNDEAFGEQEGNLRGRCFLFSTVMLLRQDTMLP